MTKETRQTQGNEDTSTFDAPREWWQRISSPHLAEKVYLGHRSKTKHIRVQKLSPEASQDINRRINFFLENNGVVVFIYEQDCQILIPGEETYIALNRQQLLLNLVDPIPVVASRGKLSAQFTVSREFKQATFDVTCGQSSFSTTFDAQNPIRSPILYAVAKKDMLLLAQNDPHAFVRIKKTA